MDGYFAFSDECGQYQQHRSLRCIKTHPFYVRSTAIISILDYVAAENQVRALKDAYRISNTTEIKWSELGNRFKGRIGIGLEDVSDKALKGYISDVVEYAAGLKSLQVVYTVFDNSADYHAGYSKMLKMNIQNALQRIQHEMELRDGYATMIIDDIGEINNKVAKEICHELMQKGDFVQYTKVKNSILVDYSHHCAGLQLADFFAGIFTSCLKKISFKRSDYDYANSLFTNHLYKLVRADEKYFPEYFTYGFGVREVPNGCGKELCNAISKEIDSRLTNDIYRELYE